MWVTTSSGSQQVYDLLDETLNLWKEAQNAKTYSMLKQLTLELIREKDYIVPRIKKGHLCVLNNLVEETDVPFVDIDLDRSKDDIRYFIDYCHPIEPANQLIADEIAKNLLSVKSGKKTFNVKQNDLIQNKN